MFDCTWWSELRTSSELWTCQQGDRLFKQVPFGCCATSNGMENEFQHGRGEILARYIISWKHRKKCTWGCSFQNPKFVFSKKTCKQNNHKLIWTIDKPITPTSKRQRRKHEKKTPQPSGMTFNHHRKNISVFWNNGHLKHDSSSSKASGGAVHRCHLLRGGNENI